MSGHYFDEPLLVYVVHDMDEHDIIIIWNRFHEEGSIINELKYLKEICELHGCEQASLGTSWCNKECELKTMIYVLEAKLKEIQRRKI